MQEKRTNKKDRHLTLERLKKFKSYEQLSEEEAQELLFTIKSLAAILYEHLNQKRRMKKQCRCEEDKEGEETRIEELINNEELKEGQI